jgi:non-ribosomal peptide synthase protein (TIGR01720 family)
MSLFHARVQLGDGVYVGTNASVLPDLKVGPWATIGVNSAVIEDVPAGATVMGVPAQIIMTSDREPDRKVFSVPKTDGPEIEKGDDAPVSGMEQALAKLWTQVLGIDKIGIHDNFFDLGADSILAVQIIGRANQLGIQLTVRQLLDHPTIAALAKVATSGEVVRVEQELVTGPVLLTPIQQWLLEQDLPELHHYNQTMLLKLPQDIDLDLLESAIGEMLKQHDALRMRLTQSEKGWQQKYDAFDDVLLTALAQAVSKWTGESKLLFDLEGHGREEIIKDVDISRTIGWFTSIFPVVLELGTYHTEGEALKSIKEQLRNIPTNGVGYGLLRYLSGAVRLAERLRSLPQAEIQFNYLGQFDQMFTGSSIFEAAPEPPGAFARVASPLQPRPYLLEILGMVVNDELRMTWLYSKNVHQRSMIESLANEFMTCLRALISHCCEKRPASSRSQISSRPISTDKRWVNLIQS